MRRLLIILSLCTASFGGLSLAVPASAPAAQSRVISDCVSHSRLTGTYTPAALRGALGAMSADVKEYTNCYDVIQRQLLAQLGGKSTGPGSGGSGGGGSFLPTPVIVVLVLLILAAVTFGAVAVRRRAGGAPPDDPSGPPDGV
jgi:hypothetical protein